jgi:hypothetical protein
MGKFSNLPWPDDDDSAESDCGSPNGLPLPFPQISKFDRIDWMFDRLRAEMSLS